MNIWKLLKCENFVNMQTTMHVLSVRSRVSIGQSTQNFKYTHFLNKLALIIYNNIPNKTNLNYESVVCKPTINLKRKHARCKSLSQRLERS